MKSGIELIAEERQEQIGKHGCSLFHDVSVNKCGAPLLHAAKRLGTLKIKTMDNKELPQEPKDLIIQMTDCILRTEDATEKELAINCTQLAMAHYEPQVTRLEKLAYEHQVEIADYLKELTAKDTTIKELEEKIEKLTGLLKDEVYKNAFTYWVKQDCTEDAAKHAADKTLNDFKEQHGI